MDEEDILICYCQVSYIDFLDMIDSDVETMIMDIEGDFQTKIVILMQLKLNKNHQI